jgi:hypothetical protein
MDVKPILLNASPLQESIPTPLNRKKKKDDIVNPPTNLSASIISNGVRITWTDSTTPGAQAELYAAVDSGEYSLLSTVNRGTQLYDDPREPGIIMHYKARAVK